MARVPRRSMRSGETLRLWGHSPDRRTSARPVWHAVVACLEASQNSARLRM